MAFFHNFLKGSTIDAIKNIVSTLTEINPEIEEELYKVWSLGHSKLYSNKIKITGSPELLPCKYNNGILIENEDQTISFPASSNLKLDEGTLEFWTIPQWNGLDNDATLTFELYKNNTILPTNEIWIGASSFHPTYNQEFKFSINKKDNPSPIGLPNAIYTETGIFIFYDDINKIWKFYAKDVALQPVTGTFKLLAKFKNHFAHGHGQVNSRVIEYLPNQLDFVLKCGELLGHSQHVFGRPFKQIKNISLEWWLPLWIQRSGKRFDCITHLGDETVSLGHFLFLFFYCNCYVSAIKVLAHFFQRHS
jgi:hypothetical protein